MRSTPRRERSTQEIANIQSGLGEQRCGEPAEITPALVSVASKKVAARFDDVNGGFGARPKFPNTMALEVLLRAGDLGRVRKALDAMRAGGIWDHLGGGFHRYSTDERWLVPHFEKMLYDNAMLLGLYVDAWRATKEPLYEQTARAIAAYVAREMTSPDGGFYATQDADSEGDEGKFFVWTPAEIDAACGDDVEALRVSAKIAFERDRRRELRAQRGDGALRRRLRWKKSQPRCRSRETPRWRPWRARSLGCSRSGRSA